MQKTIRWSPMLVLFLSLGLLTQALASDPLNKAETQISGTVFAGDTGETLVGVNVTVKGRVIGTATDFNGKFSLTVRQDPPLILVFSMIGFTSQEVEITQNSVSNLEVNLQPRATIGDEIVVSASRIEQNTLKSPVTIEKMDAIAIQESPSTSFYDAIGNLKGVDFSAQSITFKSINTRGFAANGNTRFVQLIDGIDNQAPGLNFPVGNVVGISELDLESAELIPGVASALYGPNALNGILLLNSKSPFEYQGLSFSSKVGVNHVDEEEDDASFYQDYAIRYANAVNNRFAYKFNFSYLRAEDFVGVDFRDQGPATFGAIERGETSRGNNRVFDGLNIYGDPLVSLGAIADGQIAAGNTQVAAIRSLIPDGEAGLFTPSGFAESSFVDNTTESLKLGGALHYRLTDNLEALGQFNWGSGSTVYTANDRFVLDDFSIWTAKIELRNPNFFIRGYTTQEDAGDTFAANTLASLVNVQTFIPAYFQTFAGARTQGATVEQAHAAARIAGEAAQAKPGTEAFDTIANQIKNTPISAGGAKFLDKSDLWHAEAMYNFSNIVDPSKVGIIAGANFRRYALESEGTLFALKDNGDEFDIDEFGAYVQLSKSLLDDKLNLQGSLRMDDNEFFDTQLSPRISAVYTLADIHNFRVSFQRGFGIPTTQDQFIDLDAVSRRLVGSNPALVNRYRFETNTVYSTQSVDAARLALAGGATAAAARDLLEPIEFNKFKTEKVNTFEVGYKALLGQRLLVDAYYYYSAYDDFIAEIDFTQGVPNGIRQDPGAFDANSNSGKDAIINRTVATQRFGFDINADGTVEAQGFAVGLDYTLDGGYIIGGNVAYNELISQKDLLRQGFRASFNTPEWRYNLKFSNRNFYKNFGFNVNYRWQDAFLWESAIGQGVVPSFGTLDASISWKLKDYKTMVKLGGTNVLNERFETSLANPRMGAIYYISFTFDQFMN